MKRKAVITQKRRGPAPTGKGVLLGVRLQPDALARLDNWVIRQDEPLPSRPEAIRRLVELGLTSQPARGQFKEASKAAKLASDQIDRMGDTLATDEQRQSRKRRLLKGPKEFRDGRRDHPTKSKI